jgi:uncharacterized DUF497 family protein
MPQFDRPDPNKARINLRKHGVSFEEAETIWQGPTLTEVDDLHSDDEVRFTTIGMVAKKRKVVRVTHTEEGNTIRIISARPASSREIERYYEATRGYPKKR